MGDDNKIVFLNTMTRKDIPVERVLHGLVDDADSFDSVLVLSFTKDGLLDTRSSSGNVGLMLEMMELFKYNLLQGKYDNGAD